MDKIIKVTIERKESEATLVFHFDTKMELCLSSSNVKPVENFFQKLLLTIFDNYKSESKTKFTMLFEDDSNDLFHDVVDKYITNLNNEIKSIYTSLDN